MNAATVVETVRNCVSIFLVATTAAVCRATLYKVTRNLAKMLMSVALIMEAVSLAATIQSPHTTVHAALDTCWQLINTAVRT